jgi:acyl-CoA synthetase (AMP-forming)/AMP-acid ligase II
MCLVYSSVMDLKDKFPSAYAVLNIYGQSEGGSGVAFGLSQKTLGQIMCPAVRVSDPATGEALGPNIVGEIIYKSDSPMIGYINHPEENEKFFGKEGFFHSGDLGHYDVNGALYFDGRLKELIKYKNFHLYPNELEELILSHDAVEDTAVFGKPEASVQELVTALVVRKKNSGVTEEDLRKLVDDKVDNHKRLRGGVHFVEKIPRNPQGKILRKNLINILK